MCAIFSLAASYNTREVPVLVDIVFCWFAPEIERYDRAVFDFWQSGFLKRRELTDHAGLRQFIDRFEDMKAQDWALQRELCVYGYPRGSVEFFIKHDDVDGLQNVITLDPKWDMNATVWASVFEVTDVADRGPTMLQFAAFHGAIRCVKYLLLNGSNPVFCVHEDRNTTASFAVSGGNPEIIRLLQEKIPTLTFEECTIDAIINFRQEVLEWLTENGLDILESAKNARRSCGVGRKEAIHEAARCGNLEAVLFCLQQGIDSNGSDRYGTRPLMTAAGGGIDVLRFLLERVGSDVNAVNVMGVFLIFTIARFSSL
jgi:hypothetical protein